MFYNKNIEFYQRALDLRSRFGYVPGEDIKGPMMLAAELRRLGLLPFFTPKQARILRHCEIF
jgi:hypothetical protein